MMTRVWECTYCPKIGNHFQVSDLEYTLIRIDPGCPNCNQSWEEFKSRTLAPFTEGGKE